MSPPLKLTALDRTALHGDSKPSCARLYTTVFCRRAFGPVFVRYGFESGLLG